MNPYRDADPSQHILDTLEQCISVIIEKIQRLDQDKANNSRMSSLEYNRVNDGKINCMIKNSGTCEKRAAFQFPLKKDCGTVKNKNPKYFINVKLMKW